MACNVIKMTHKANGFSPTKCKILVTKEKLIHSKAYLKLEATCISACLLLLSSVVLPLFEWNPCDCFQRLFFIIFSEHSFWYALPWIYV